MMYIPMCNVVMIVHRDMQLTGRVRYCMYVSWHCHWHWYWNLKSLMTSCLTSENLWNFWNKTKINNDVSCNRWHWTLHSPHPYHQCHCSIPPSPPRPPLSARSTIKATSNLCCFIANALLYTAAHCCALKRQSKTLTPRSKKELCHIIRLNETINFVTARWHACAQICSSKLIRAYFALPSFSNMVLIILVLLPWAPPLLPTSSMSCPPQRKVTTWHFCYQR